MADHLRIGFDEDTLLLSSRMTWDAIPHHASRNPGPDINLGLVPAKAQGRKSGSPLTGSFFQPDLVNWAASPYLCPAFQKADLVAQPVEHLTFNQRVMGSSPIEITPKSLAVLSAGLFL